MTVFTSVSNTATRDYEYIYFPLRDNVKCLRVSRITNHSSNVDSMLMLDIFLIEDITLIGDNPYIPYAININ
jgi:hypothetical protein